MFSKRARFVATVALMLGWVAGELRAIPAQQPPVRRGALRIAKLRHAGDWDVAPMAIPNLTETIRARLKFAVAVAQKDVFPRDPILVRYPLIYVNGSANFLLDEADRDALRRHLIIGNGTIFADAARGSPDFDAAFRRLVADLMPNDPLVPIPVDDKLLTKKCGADLADVRMNPAAGNKVGPPELEGVKFAGRWAIIYSKYDIGCALDNPAGANGKGYDHQSALKIAANVVQYATQ